MHKLHGVLLLLLNFQLIKSQVPIFSRCEHIETVQNFTIDNFLGDWYEAEKYPFILQIGGKCIKTTYYKIDNETISIRNFQINQITDYEASFTGQGIMNAIGQYTVTFPFLSVTYELPYWVLDTDYTQYAVIYSCKDLTSYLCAQYLWILTRERHPNVEILQKAYAVLDKNKISKTYLLRTNQNNCIDNNFENILI